MPISKVLQAFPNEDAEHFFSETLPPLHESLNPDQMLEQLISAVIEFLGALTESTERVLHLRQLLSGLLEDLRMKARSVAHHRAVCVPRLVVSGPRRSGRSALVNFIRQCRSRQSLDDDGLWSPCVPLSGFKRPLTASGGVFVADESPAASAIPSLFSNGRREGHSRYVKSERDEAGERASPALQTRTGRRRLLSGASDELALHGGPSFRFVTVTTFPEWHAVGSDESRSPSEPTPRELIFLPGAFDRTIFDHIARYRWGTPISRSTEAVDAERFMKLASSAATAAAAAAAQAVQAVQVASRGMWHEGLRAASWILYENHSSSSGSDIMWREDKRASSAYHIPEFISAETIFFTIPCDFVGTQRLSLCLKPLFGSYNRDCKDACEDACKCECECEAEVRQIRQHISDMVFYVLTFTDAITTRVDGVLSLDASLHQRPPPVATTLRHLVDLFIAQMRRVCGVDVAPWQVIPFSNVTSRVTSDFFTALFEGHIRSSSCDPSESFLDSLQSSGVSTKHLNFSLVSSPHSFRAPPLSTAVSDFCDVVFGERFQRRRAELVPEQIDRMALDYAITNTWFTSGANQLLRTLRGFEWSALLHYLHCTTVSLLLWSRQLMLALPDVRRALRAHIRGVRIELRQIRCEEKLAEDAMQQFRKDVVPHEIFHDIHICIQQRFEDFTVRFWRRLVALIESDGNDSRYNNNNDDEAEDSDECPRALIEARQRLLLQYQMFVRFYVSSHYERQMAQLLRLLAEENGGTESALDVPGSFPTVDHIPFVAANVRPLKAAMERELTLQLSRLNTEVINYFMAELGYDLSDFTFLCDSHCNATVSRLSRVLRPLLCAQRHRSLTDIASAQAAIAELSRLSLMRLHMPVSLEAFVTGMRGALCEDQILLILRHRESIARARAGGHAATTETLPPPRRTVAYLTRMDRENHERRPRQGEMLPALQNSCTRRAQLPGEMFWAPLHVEHVAPVREQWLHRSMCADEKSNPPPNSTDDTHEEEEQRHAKKGPMGDAEGMSARNELNEDKPLKCIWFVMDVWREALSTMSFRPWMQLRNVDYGKLLNKFSLSFITGHRKLTAEIAEEAKHVEKALRSNRKENSCLEVDIPAALQRISNTATCVAGKIKRSSGDLFATALMENKA